MKNENETIKKILDYANAELQRRDDALKMGLENAASNFDNRAIGLSIAAAILSKPFLYFNGRYILPALLAIFATFAGFGSPAEIAQWQNNLRQDAAIYRANAADCRTTTHKDRETVARKLEREADKADALAAAMTDKLAAAYAAAAAAENAAHRALVEWQKANTAKAADEAEKDAAATRALCESHKAQRRLKKAQNAALKNAAK